MFSIISRRSCPVLRLGLSGYWKAQAKRGWLNTHTWSQYFHFSAPFISTILKTSNHVFSDHDPEHKLNLICAETWPAGQSCLCDDIDQVEKYRPPLAPMHILSSAAAITLLSCGQPWWHHPLNKSSKSYLLTLIKRGISNKGWSPTRACGEKASGIYYRLGRHVTPAIRPELVCLRHLSLNMQIKESGTYKRVSGSKLRLELFVTDVGSTWDVNEGREEREDFQGKQHKEGVTVA